MVGSRTLGTGSHKILKRRINLMRKPIYKNQDNRQEGLWSDFTRRYLEEHIESHAEISDTDPEKEQELRKHFRTMANTHFSEFVRKKLDEFIKGRLAVGEIWKKPDYPYNRSWIVNDAGIKKTLERYPKLLDVINFIDKEGQHDESVCVEGWTTFSVETAQRTEGRKYSHVIVGKDFYRRAFKRLVIKKNTMQKYLQIFSEVGILQKIKQLKSHKRAMLYVDGYFRQLGEGGITKKEHFMNQRDHQKALRHFEY
jgi:hypothetical protein